MKNHLDCLKHTFPLALLINAFFLATVLLCFYTHYETDDDTMMAMLLCGAISGTPTPFLLFINVVVAWPLCLLAKVLPGVPWYPLAEYAVVFCGFTAISYVFIRANRKRGCLVAWLLLCSFGFNFYTQMQFTKVAGVAAAAGALLILDAVSRDERHTLQALFGALMFLVGSAYRFRMALPVLVLMSGAALFVAVRALRERNYRILCREIAWLMAVALCAFSLDALNSYVYSRAEGWAEHRIYSADRSQLLDRSFPDYEENVELYESLGLTEADIQLYQHWDFADPALFNRESARAMAAARKPVTVDGDFWVNFAKKIPAGYLQYVWIPAFLTAAALAVYASRKNLFYLLFSLLLLGVFSAYLMYFERYLQARVDVCVFLALSVSLLFLYQQTAPENFTLPRGLYALSLWLVLLLSLPNVSSYLQRTADSRQIARESRELTDAISEDVDHMYFISTLSAKSWDNGFGIWESYPAGYRRNACYTGGCSCYTPIWFDSLRAYGLENPFADCVDNDVVYFLDNRHINTIVSYINRHYNPDATATLVRQINDNMIYRIASSAPVVRDPISEALPADLIVKDLSCGVENGCLNVSARVYREGVSSFQGEAMLELIGDSGETRYAWLCQYETEETDGDGSPLGDAHGQFSVYSGGCSFHPDEGWRASLLYRSEGVWYRVCELVP